MSRPDDRHHTFRHFGNPFRIIFSRGPHLAPKPPALLVDFELMLAASLANLKPNDSSEFLSLSWMGQAIESLSKIHTNIKGLITDLEFPVSDWDEKWIDVYLDGSVKLLDICIAFTSELSRFDQSQLFLQSAVQMLDDSANSSLHDWKSQFRSKNLKLENCRDILESLAASPNSEEPKNSDKSNVLMRALYGVRVHTVIVCGAIAASLSGCSKLLIELQVPDEFMWSEAFNELQTAFLTEIRTHLSSERVVILRELEAVELRVERLRELTGCVRDKEEGVSSEISGVCIETAAGGGEELREFVSDLAERCEKLSEGLDLLTIQIDGFFQVVLTGRDALLSNLRASNRMRGRNEEENAVR